VIAPEFFKCITTDGQIHWARDSEVVSRTLCGQKDITLGDSEVEDYDWPWCPLCEAVVERQSDG
jgi:hypothetical protein